MAIRTSRYVRVAEIALVICKNTLPLYSHLKSPHRFTLPQLTASVLVMFYVRKSYRDMEEWLLATESVCQALELNEVPDHTTLYRAFKRLRMATFERMQHSFLDQLSLHEVAIALDTTGFQPTQASVHYLARCGRKYDHFIKGGYAVGTNSLLILGWKQGLGPGADTMFLEPLRRQARRYGSYIGRQPAWFLLADKGFDGITVQDGDLIPPIRRGGVMKSPKRKARLDLVSAARLDGIFGQRWKAETVNSVIKRKFGDEIRSRKKSHRRREPIVKGLIYNIHVC